MGAFFCSRKTLFQFFVVGNNFADAHPFFLKPFQTEKLGDSVYARHFSS